MGIQTMAFFKGRVGNLVFYQRQGKQLVRIQASNIKQSPASKARSRNMAIASPAGSAIREQLEPLLPFPKDGSMQTGFCGKLVRWIGREDVNSLPPCNPVPFVNGFSFNAATGIAERWKVALAVTQPALNSIQVSIPAFVPTTAVAAPAHTVSVACSIAAAACRLKDGIALGSSIHTFNIPYTNELVPAQDILLQAPAGNGILTVTAVRLQYQLANGQYCNKKTFMPAGVIGAVYGQELTFTGNGSHI